MSLLFISYFILGLVTGSFLNVCIYRLPLGKSVINPPSSCGSCGHRLSPLDMIPVLSYFLLRGRCRYCGATYSMRYAGVELLTGLLFMVTGLYFLPGTPLTLAFIFVAALVTITFIDLDHQIIPDEIVVLLIISGLAYLYARQTSYLEAAYGALFAGGMMFAIYILSRGGMGAGDVKLSFALGLWLGFQGSIVFLLLAFILGGVIGIFLLATGLKTRKDPIPFGPFLCLGALLSFLYAPYIIYYYWSIFI
ncbi:MAG TPA: prepilin peptidase [Candidatus Avacidaminococcus intestinavium]|uniref:Prepilin peptidase n=1 Tax=Candidatus Avacidaminococcus intestinavium TaxID=2840684 RepID=A0A9D1MPQ6_9FIRM|nr:prepilin peptidase [Candidatus Avacidaminococcus intestinavium]